MIVRLLPSRAQTRAQLPLLPLPNLPMLPLADPSREPGKQSPRTGKSNGTAGEGKFNDLQRKADQELPKCQRNQPGCRAECVPGHHQQFSTTRAHVWQKMVGQVPGSTEGAPMWSRDSAQEHST